MGGFERVVTGFAAETLVPAGAGPVGSAIAQLATELWGDGCAVVVDEPGSPIVHAVDGEVWLTWTLEPVGARATKVRLLLEEQACQAPAPDLDTVLLLLLRRCLLRQDQ